MRTEPIYYPTGRAEQDLVGASIALHTVEASECSNVLLSINSINSNPKCSMVSKPLDNLKTKIETLMDIADHFEARGLNVKLVDKKIRELQRLSKKLKYFTRMAAKA